MKISMKLVAAGLAVTAATITAVAPAAAITDTIFKYTTDKTGYLSISTMAFTVDGSSTASNTWFNGWSGNVLSGDGCFNTGINLPNGSKIINVRVMYTKGVDAYLIATERETGNSTYISSINRSLSNTTRVGFTQTLDTPHTVDNNVYQYGMGVCLGTDETFQGARIGYTYSTAGD